jgi:hypothetical protein
MSPEVSERAFAEAIERGLRRPCLNESVSRNRRGPGSRESAGVRVAACLTC